jgi:uncharacterized protein (TIGR00661 family)
VKRILVSPLSWGLGHATRDLPIIRELRDRGHHVTIAACGRALALLEREVPACDFVELEDYPSPYTASRWFVLKFLAMAPQMVLSLKREARAVRRLLAERDFDLIISDNRFHVRSPRIPSFFISHQLRFSTPFVLRPLEFLTEVFNAAYHRHFTGVIVPDFPDPEENLSGRLSHGVFFAARNRLHYAGVLASVRRLDVTEDVDVFISISGPEPQRTELERLVLDQVPALGDARVVITLGKPEVAEVREPGPNVTVYGFLDRERQQEMLNRARLVVCRSGYTTVMELAELGKRALFIPTPGQTEQEYLSRHYARHGYFHSVSQYELDPARDVERAREALGFPFEVRTAENVRRLYDDLFAPILDA